jgi:mannose-6-phosphate isomerase-like protein (cupin superfamily)
VGIVTPQGILGKLSFALATAALAAGCTSAPRTIVLPRGPESAAALLAAHPAEAGRNITPYPLAESPDSSRLLVWIRDREQLHIHAKHDLTVVLLRGQGTLQLRDQQIPMAEGDIAFIPAGTPHAFVNAGTEPAASFATFSPQYDGTDTSPP